MNKRLLGGLLAAGIIGGGVYGFAATLDVDPGALGAGDEVVASCDTDGVDTSYTTAWDETDEQYQVTSVTVSEIATACEGADINVSLVDDDGAQIGEGTQSTVSGTSKTFTLVAGTSAEDVVGAHVVIDG